MILTIIQNSYFYLLAIVVFLRSVTIITKNNLSIFFSVLCQQAHHVLYYITRTWCPHSISSFNTSLLDLIFDILLLKVFRVYFCGNKSFVDSFLIKMLRIKSSINSENVVEFKTTFVSVVEIPWKHPIGVKSTLLSIYIWRCTILRMIFCTWPMAVVLANKDRDQLINVSLPN